MSAEEIADRISAECKAKAAARKAEEDKKAEALPAFRHGSELADVLIGRLNEILKADPEAIRQMLAHKVECTEALVQHPTVMCTPDDPPRVGFLGLLNGLVGKVERGPASGRGLITAVVGDKGEVIEFKRTDVCFRDY